jgi:NRAMP (natural resistance-associated macrophage protein)-like metal ion transporter
MPEQAATPRARAATVIKALGPGLVTGAADDDPSGIATYSQAGAQFGFSMLWTVIFTYPLMVGIQIVSARIGRVTGYGVAANIRRHYPPWLLYCVVGLLLLANTINIAADIGAMGDAVHLIMGGPSHLYTVIFGLVSVFLQIFMPYPRYAPLLKWLVLALFAYVATAFIVQVPWLAVVERIVWPRLELRAEYVTMIVAVFGTTISPYLFFWQASQEVEDQRAAAGEEPLIEAPQQAARALWRIKVDTYIGMGFSNLVAFFIMLTTAVTLNAHGITEIQTSSQAAEALRPLAGDFAFYLFSAGLIGTGMLAIPVLAGSAAYAVAETFKWRSGLALKPVEGRGFYGIVAAATMIGVAINFMPVDPIKALFWSAVVNGVIAVPVMAVMMLMAVKPAVMGQFVIKRELKLLGWSATAVMAAAVVVMFLTLFA